MDLHRPCKVSPQSVAIRVREEGQSVRISPAHRTPNPAIETLCAGAHAQPRTGRRSGAGRSRALVKEQFWQPGTNLGAWLFTIMHNQNVNNVRRAVRESGMVDMETSTTLPATTDPTASRQMFELERALAQLPLEQRQVILLVGLEGMSYEDAAGILSVPVGTVRSRLSRGRDALRKLLDTEERRSSATLPQAA